MTNQVWIGVSFVFILGSALFCTGSNHTQDGSQGSKDEESLGPIPVWNPILSVFAPDFDLIDALDRAKDKDDMTIALRRRELTCEQAFDKVKWVDLLALDYFINPRPHVPSTRPMEKLMGYCQDDLNLDIVQQMMWRTRWCAYWDAAWFCPQDLPKMSKKDFQAWWAALTRFDRATVQQVMSRGTDPATLWPTTNVEAMQTRLQAVDFQVISKLFHSETLTVLDFVKANWGEVWSAQRKVDALFDPPKDSTKGLTIIRPAEASASSTLMGKDQKPDTRYLPQYAIDSDGMGKTYWTADPSDTRPTLTMKFSSPVTIARIRLVAGASETEEGGYLGRAGFPMEVLVTLERTDGSKETVPWRLTRPFNSDFSARVHFLYPLMTNQARIGGVVSLSIQPYLVWKGRDNAHVSIADVGVFVPSGNEN